MYPPELRNVIGNRKLVDATKPLRIEVTDSDVKKARRLDPSNCAFAKACVRENPSLVGAYFSKTRAFLIYPRRAVRYALPFSMQAELTSFDRSRSFAPGQYRLSAISPSRRMGQRHGSGTNRRSGDKKSRFTHRTIMIRGASDK